MNRILLVSATLLCTIFAHSQVITYVQSPAPLETNLAFTWASPPNWSTPNFEIPGTFTSDTLAIALDALGDSTVCDPGGIVTNVSGKIALIWRGDCGFGTKALRAQNAGATGVVMINNVGAPVEMGAGADGANVTIPVVMVSTVDGQVLMNAVNAGTNVVMYLGYKQGLFGNDIGMYKADALIAPLTGKPTQIASSATEFNSLVGSWIKNYGSNDAYGVTLNCDITEAGVSVYNETSQIPDTIIAGDSVFVQLPNFSLASYNGFYEMNYTVSSDSIDEFGEDDAYSSNFMIDEFFSHGIIDPVAGLPAQQQFIQIANQTAGIRTCLAFRDANASRLKTTGIWGAAVTAADDSLSGRILNSQIWQWDDIFTDINDADVQEITMIDEGQYIYPTDQQNEVVWIPFNNEIALEDNQRYIFCIATFDNDMFLGHDGSLDYDENRNNAAVSAPQPINMLYNGATSAWNLVGFGTDIVPAIAVAMADNDVSIKEEEALAASPAYPNPAVNFVQIPLSNANVSGDVQIFDLEGRLVATQPVQFNGNTLVVDMSDVSNGVYTFKLTNDQEAVQSFRVVISK